MFNSKLARIALLALGAGWVAVASSAFAHTVIKNQTTEGIVDDNFIKIEHGCEESDKPVIAESVVFPGDDADVSASNGSAVKLIDIIEQGSIAGLVATIQDRAIFLSQQDKMDANENQIGFSGTRGVLALGKQGRVPFAFTAPNFVFNSCAKRLLIQVAIADICVRGGQDTLTPDKVNLWIPDNSKSYYSSTGKTNDVEGIGSPATLIVNRNLTVNPLAPVCGAGFDVTVAPSAAAMDANLPIPGFWK